MGETTSVNRGWQERFVEPHPAITGERDRQQTRALSWLTLITTPVIFIASLLGGTLFTIEAIILLLAMAAGYGLSRTPRVGIGKLVTLLGLTLPVMVVPFVNPEVFTPLIGDGTLIDLIQVLVMYMAFPMFLSVVIVDARQASAVNFIIWAGMIAVTLNVPEVTLASEVIPLTILALIGITASIVAFLRERDQDVIIQEVQKREEINRSLENRVQERTNDLATSAEIASAANQVRQLEELISLAVNLIRDRFGFYYVQIYLLDETGEYAELADGTGYVGRRLVGQNHRLSMRQDTIVTEAIKSGQSNVIQDVSQHPTFLQNELLPDTKAELAVPLRAQDKVIGALDIQADETDIFEESERRLFETLADQLAVTFENAQLFQQSEERARQLETVAQVSIEASTSLDLKELLRSVSKLTRDNFDLYHAHIYLLQNDTLLLSGGAGEAGLLMVEQGHSISLHMEHSLVARAARSGQPVLSNDIREEPDYLPNELLPNTRSELALPLLAGENVIGVMDVQSDRVNEFDDTDIQIHSTLAAQVSVAVQNARAFAEADAAREEARIREQRFRTLLENAPEAIFVLNGNTGRFTEVNRVTEKTFGYSEDELTDMTPLDLSPEYQSDGQLTETVVGSTVQKALRGEEAQTQWEGFTRDGERRVFDMRLVRLPGADNLLRVSATDITEARQIQRLRDVQFNISQKLNAAQNPQEILEAVVQFASESGLSMGNLYYTSNVGRQEPEEVLCVAAWSDNEDIEPTPVGTSFKLNQFAVVRRWMDEPEEVLLHENVIADSRVDDATQAVYETIGIKAAAVVPLYQGGRWIGLYIFGWQDAQTFGQFEANILESVRQQSIAVVDAVQSAEQLRKRADELAVVAEVGTAAASILDVERLLKTVSDLTKEKFALYHAHVYLLDDSGKYRVLKLAAGAGEVGDLMVSGAHQIRYDREGSIVAGAARNRQTYIVNDVTAEADFLPNPLLPETRAELAVPMIAADNLVGVLDVQSDKASYFTQEDAQVLQTLATQVAVAIDNAQLFAQSQERASQLETVAQVATQASSNVDLDEMLRTVSNLTKEKFNLYHAHIYLLDSSGSRLNLAAGAGEAGLKMVQSKHKIALNKQESLVATAARNHQNVIVNDVTAEDDFLPNPLLPDTRAELSVPMTVGDELIGVLDVQSSRAAAFDDEDARVLQILATQLAVAVKNARLFKDVNDIRFAIDQHSIVAITDQTGEIQYANQKFADISKFEIDELIGQDHRIINSGYHSKEFIRNLWTTIANGQVWKGEIKNQTRDGDYYWVDTTIVPFMNSEGKPYQYIAIRTDITEQKRAQEDIRRRARELESAALVSAETASELDADKLLWAVANLTKEEFNRYHAHIYLANQNTQSLDLVAGAGATGRLMVNEGHSIPLNAESLVARAAREREPVLINDVMGDKDFLPNPNLPETRSEMAVPIVYGDQLLGVLDIQDDEPDAFDEVERQVFSTLTNQIGVALQNARTFELTQRRLDEVMANNRISEYVRADVPLEAMLENVFQVVLDTLQPTNIVMSRYDADEQRWHGMIGVGMDMTTETAKTFDDPVGTYPHGMEALESGEIVLVEDVREYPDFPQNYIEDLGLASVLVIPLIVEGDPYGVAFLNYVDEQRLFTSEDTRLSRSIANQVSTALERRVAQERIRQQSALVETSEDFIGIATLDGEALYLNPAGHAMTRYEAGDVIGEPIVMFYPDYERGRLNDEIMPAVMNEGRWRGEVDFIRKDGSTFPVDHTLFIITDEAGNPLNIATVSTDITERTRQQQRQLTLLKLSSLLNDAQSPEDVLDVFVTYGTEQGALSSAILFYMAGELGQQNGGGPLPDELIASATWHAEDMQLVVEPGVRYDLEVFPSAKDWMDNPYAPVIYEDTQQAQTVDDITRAMYEAIGAGSSVVLPMYSQERWIGLILLGWKEPRHVDQQEESIYSDMMLQAPAVLESLRTAQQLQRRASELQTVAQVSATTTTLLDVDELLQSVVDLTKDRFNLYHAHVYLIGDDDNILHLAAGSGEAGRIMKENEHSIPIDRAHSIVAHAARDRESQIVNDVTGEPDFLPNPLLPDTRSEMAIPMTVGDELIGVLDVQSDMVGRFDAEDVMMKETLADQISVAVQNARAFERERQTIKRLKEVDRLKQEFLANMSHELRTPLNSIIGYSEVLLDGVDGELNGEMEEDVGAIYSSGKHLLSIINEILDLAKIDAGQMQLSLREMDITELLGDVVKNNEVLLKDRPVSMQLVEEDPVDSVYIDPVRLHQVMLNLVGNSVKFTEEGSITVRYGRFTRDFIYIRVEDTGMGMSEEQLKVIFERFRQVDGSSTRRAGGTGLGLTITKQLIEMHGGTVHVESAEGEGTTFWFTLPTAEAAQREEANGRIDITEEPAPQAGD